MKNKPDDQKFTPEEAQKRFEAALRGARVAGHKTMKQVADKKKAAKKKRS